MSRFVTQQPPKTVCAGRRAEGLRSRHAGMLSKAPLAASAETSAAWELPQLITRLIMSLTIVVSPKVAVDNQVRKLA